MREVVRSVVEIAGSEGISDDWPVFWSTDVRAKLATAAAVTAAIAVTGAAAVPPATAATPKLTISPQRGTPNASPDTQISILGVPPSKIKSVVLTGDESGPHLGNLLPYSGNRGASFVSPRALDEGERASFTVKIAGRKPINSWFEVGVPGLRLPFLNLTTTQPEKLRHFQSLPDLIPPKIEVDRNIGGTSGAMFLTPLPSPTVHPGSDNTVTIEPVGPGGPMIANRAGQVVWFRQLESPTVAANLRIQRYQGKKVLTWWQGGVTPWAYGEGEGVIADTSYRTVATVKAGNGYEMDLHEFELTDDGDALFTIYKPQLVQLPDKPEGTLSRMMDAIVQQVDIKTGLVVWEWHAFGNIPLEDSLATPENSVSYDAYHFNSIQMLGGGRVLISARNTSAVYKVDPATGRILWTLGGKSSSFEMKPGTQFDFQHDALLLKTGEVSLFDDSAGPPQKRPYSRGLVLKLNHGKKVARLANEYVRSEDTSAESEGSVQRRRDGNVFVGYGSEPNFSEFTRNGKLLYDARQPEGNGSYRVYRHLWRATPKTRPDATAIDNGEAGVSVFVSWNGATTVRRWQVLVPDGSGGFAVAGSAKKRGFETRIDIEGPAYQVKVRAIGDKGRILSTTDAVDVVA